MTTVKETSEGFYFLSLSLENVRCFAGEQTLDLSDGNGRPAQWTVILGDNGTGKTTLLEILGQGIQVFDYHPNSLQKIGATKSKIQSSFAFNASLVNSESNFLYFKTETSINESGLCSFKTFPKKNTLKYKDWHPRRRAEYEPCVFVNDFVITESMKLSISYSANRGLKDCESFSRSNMFKIVNYGTEELINAEEWLLQTDYIANKLSDIQESYKKRLTLIKEVLISLLPDIKDIRISEPSEKSPNPRVEFQMPDGWLLLSQLSLGYQTMTAWMVDLAARLFNFYPDSPNPIAEPAIVLIDEIDLHLHPKWQRTIMSYLSERFVNTQFIVTAHSPLIVQAAENANIVVLKREADGVVIHQEHQDVHGWRVDQLLTSDLFDLKSARSPHYENLLEQRRQILSKPELDAEDHAQLNTLKAEIGDLPTADTAEDIKAMDIIRRAAQLLKPDA